MDLILHIGTEKTGSTSFQTWAQENRDALGQNGIWYSQSLGHRNHQKIYLWALGAFGPDDGFARLGIADQDGFLRFQRDVPEALAQEIETARAEGCRCFVISSEHCHSRLVKPEQVRRLRDMLAPMFNQIRVVCVLRPQLDMGVSLKSTAARVGHRVNATRLEEFRPHDLYYNFEMLNGRWSAAFGPQAMRYLPYNRGPDMIGWMQSEFDLDTSEFVDPPRTNTALDVRTMAIMNALTTLPPQQQEALRPVLIPFLDALPVKDRLRPGRDLAQKIQARFSVQNARLIDRRPDLDPGDLEPDWSRYPEDGNGDDLEQPAPHDGHMALLLVNLARHLTLTDLRRAVSEAERAAQAKHDTRSAKLTNTIHALRDRLGKFGGGVPEQLDRRIARVTGTPTD